MLEIDIHKRLKGFELTLQCSFQGGFTAICGSSGAGKTTLLNMISGLLHPDEGRIVLKEEALFDSRRGISARPQDRRVGYIFQESRLFPHMTIRQNICYGLNKLPKDRRRFTEADVIAQLGIAPLLERAPQLLSGGEKQRCALARALLASPELLLMDEPMAALDQETRQQFLHFLKKIQKEYQLPILYVSHDLHNVIHFADELLLMEAGRCQAQGNPREILEKASAHRSLSINRIAADITAHRADVGLTTVQASGAQIQVPLLDLPVGASISLFIDAADIIVSVQRPELLSNHNVIKGNILRHIPQKTHTLLAVDSGVSIIAAVSRAAADTLSPGDSVYLIFAAHAIRLAG